MLQRRIEINGLSAAIDGDQSAALWGRGRSNANRQVGEIESEVLADWQSWCYALEHAGLKQERRDLVLRPQDLIVEWTAEQQLRLQFSLNSGCYATALLREIAQLFRPQHRPL